MITESAISALCNDFIAGSDRFLVDVKVKPGNRIFVFIDSDTSVAIEHCVALSRHIESSLGPEEDFELNVSSSGLDQPYRLPRQYRKNIGRDVIVKLTDKSQLTGTLTAADDEGINLLIRTKEKKIIIETNRRLAYTEIKETKEIIKF